MLPEVCVEGFPTNAEENSVSSVLLIDCKLGAASLTALEDITLLVSESSRSRNCLNSSLWTRLEMVVPLHHPTLSFLCPSPNTLSTPTLPFLPDLCFSVDVVKMNEQTP